MPSGSKKRKSSKKPRPQGDSSELEVGLEEAMANAGEEVGEATPSPTGMEGDPEATAERGLDGNGVNGEFRQEGAREDSQIDEPPPDCDVGGQGDPPPQAEPEREIPPAFEAEAPAVIELEGETVQQETEPQIDTPVIESEAKNDATTEEIKSEVESDAVPIDSEPIVDATPDAAPNEIKPDAVIGLDEIESSKESTKFEREFEFDAAPLGNESRINDSFVEMESKSDAASADVEPEIDKAPDELDVAAAPAEVELEIGEPSVEVKPEVDAAPYIERETDEALDEVPVELEPETDGVPAEIKPEAQVEEPETVSAADIESQTEEALGERELVTDAAPTDFETEGEERQVEDPEIAVPAEIEPETEEVPMERELVTDAAPVAEVEEAPVERELTTDAAIIDAGPETDAGPVDVEAEMNTAQIEADALQYKVPREIDTAVPENETETDVAVQEFESEADTAVVELDPPTEVSPVEIEPAVSAEPEPQVEALVEEEPEVNAEDVAAPEPQPEVEALAEEEPEVSTDDVENSAEIEARTVLPQETEPELKRLDLAEETSFEPTEETEPELEVEAVDNTKFEDEAFVETNAEERGSVETESYQQDFVAGEVDAGPEINPGPEVETTHRIEPEAEAEVPAEAEPESVVEAPAETELDEKGLIHTEADQRDLVEIEADQLGVKEYDEQLQNKDRELEIGDFESSVSEINQPSESQPQVAEALKVPVVEDEPLAISASDAAIPMDDATLSSLNSEASGNTDKEKTAIEPELEEGDDIQPSATTQEGEGESTIEVVFENQDSGGDIEQLSVTAVDNEQGAADELPAESKEDSGEGQENAVDVGHDDEDGAVLASSGHDGETKEPSYQELVIDLPPADVVNMEELPKEDIRDQEQAVDSGQGDDEAVLASARNGGEAEVSSEQELGTEQPPPDVVDVVECAKEGPPPSDQEPVAEQPQPLIDEQDLSMGLGAAVEPPSVESEQSLDATLSSSESKLTSDAPEPLDEAVTPASSEKVASEHEINLELATGEPERDIEEEEAASSTVAEVGSALNDFDERASFEQELLTDFPSSEQDAGVPDCKEFDDNLSTAVPESVETGSRDLLDSEPFLAEKIDASTVCQSEAISEESASSIVAEAGSVLNDFDERASYEQELPTGFTSTEQDADVSECKEFDDNLSTAVPGSVETGAREQLDSEPYPDEKVYQAEAISEQPEVLLENAEAAKPANDLHSAPVEEMPSDEQVPSSPQLVQVVQDNGKDEVHTSKEVVLANEEPRTGEEERASCEDDKVAANSILGASFLSVAGDELISKALKYMENGQQSLASSEAPSNELVEHRDELSVLQDDTNNMYKAKIHAMDSKESKEVEHNPMEQENNNHADDALVESAPPISEGRDIKDVEVFRQESTQEASLPVVLSTQDRAVEHVNSKNAERPSGGGALQRRTKLLDCCGMFDLLLRKN